MYRIHNKLFIFIELVASQPLKLKNYDWNHSKWFCEQLRRTLKIPYILSDIPQGSPILFNLFVNDFPCVVNLEEGCYGSSRRIRARCWDKCLLKDCHQKTHLWHPVAEDLLKSTRSRYNEKNEVRRTRSNDVAPLKKLSPFVAMIGTRSEQTKGENRKWGRDNKRAEHWKRLEEASRKAIKPNWQWTG